MCVHRNIGAFTADLYTPSVSRSEPKVSVRVRPRAMGVARLTKVLPRHLPSAVQLLLVFVFVSYGAAQVNAPNVFDVVPYSALQPSGAFATATSYSGSPCALAGGPPPPACTSQLTQPGNFQALNSVVRLSTSLDNSIGTALSVIPLASPASAVITKYDPQTGAELPASSTLGPIFTERAETIGKNKFFIGVSNQDFHFKSINGQQINNLTLLDPGGIASAVRVNGTTLNTFPLTFNVSADVRLEQNMAFLTYGVTNRFDISVGLPVVHAAVSARSYNGLIYVGDGVGDQKGALEPNCWCASTFTPGSPPVNAKGQPDGSGLFMTQINSSSLAKTGFGDVLVRAKGNVLERSSIALALGVDVRLPTGDANNFLGTGAIAVKPFAALSLYTKQFRNGFVFSPHVNVGWQIAGKSILGGGVTGATTVPLTNGFSALGPPLLSGKDYLPDVFSWAVGSEFAFGHHNTVVVDLLGNQIGGIHGILNVNTQSVSNALPPQTSDAQATPTNISGFGGATRVSFGQYSGAFGYKARIVGNLVVTFNELIRFDNNGLTARATPLFGLSYTF
jgi:hypothetical protein